MICILKKKKLKKLKKKSVTAKTGFAIRGRNNVVDNKSATNRFVFLREDTQKIKVFF